jgi:hypothetical protein
MRVSRLHWRHGTTVTVGFVANYIDGRRRLLTPDLNDYVNLGGGEQFVFENDLETSPIRARDFTPHAITNLFNTLPREEAAEFESAIECYDVVDLIRLGVSVDDADDVYFNDGTLTFLFDYAPKNLRSLEYRQLVIDYVLVCMSRDIPLSSHVLERSFLTDAIIDEQRNERYVILMLLWARERKNVYFKQLPLDVMRNCLVPSLKCALKYKIKVRDIWTQNSK